MQELIINLAELLHTVEVDDMFQAVTICKPHGTVISTDVTVGCHTHTHGHRETVNPSSTQLVHLSPKADLTPALTLHHNHKHSHNPNTNANPCEQVHLGKLGPS